MRRRKITSEHIERRTEILRKIEQCQPLSEQVRKLQTSEGFHELYCEIRLLYPNNIEAYEAIEEHYMRIFGQRKYSEYDSFRGSIAMTKKKTNSAL